MQRVRFASRWVRIGCVGVLGTFAFAGLPAHPAAAAPPTIAGQATNFDVGNGTDKECEGFEVDIEDITDTQVTYTWPGTPGYPNPYGSAKTITNTTFPDGHSGVAVRMTATYSGGSWDAFTPIGSIDHFGVHVVGTPGTTTYTWLCDSGTSHSTGSTGTLLPYGGTTAGNYYTMPSAPAVVPSIVPTPSGEAVQPVIAPALPPEPGEAPLPDAVWVVKYEASSPNVVDVNNLVITDPEVQQAIANSQIPSVGELFQPDAASNPEGTETEAPDVVNPGDQSSVTVTETYTYTGPVDPADNSFTCTEVAGDPNNCNNFVGPMIARQMASTQLTTSGPRAALNVSVMTGNALSTAGGNVTSTPLPGNANPESLDCGSDAGACLTNVDNPTTVELSAAPNPGYDFLRWTGACTGTTSTCAVSVTGGRSVTATFVLAITPTSATPARLPLGATRTVTIKGSGFQAGATVSVPGGGVSVGTTTTTATQVKAALSISPAATLGSRDLVITNANGHAGTCAGCLTISAPPAATTVSPGSIAAGAKSLVVLVDGSNFAPGAKVVASGAGVTIKTTVLSPSQLRLAVTAATTAGLGARDLTITNPDGGTTTCAGCLTVDAPPTVTSLTPNHLARGTTLTIAIIGTNLTPGLAVKFSGTGLVVGAITYVSPTEVDVTVTAGPTATTGNRTITVTAVDGGKAVRSAALAIVV